jgi:hypothetical protein
MGEEEKEKKTREEKDIKEKRKKTCHFGDFLFSPRSSVVLWVRKKQEKLKIKKLRNYPGTKKTKKKKKIKRRLQVRPCYVVARKTSCSFVSRTWRTTELISIPHTSAVLHVGECLLDMES